ncbi:calcium/sodium antiporter, partial [Candidatus Bathyarchaeota archaeon]|nr:calcium/sodium antiporter [Candidatus Bathyarchaeota archaeon]
MFAQLTVYSASDIAIVFGVPAILGGAKLVAIGTSPPELTLDITAVRRGRVQLAIGDIIGSNLNNLTLVLRIILLVSHFQVDMTIFRNHLILVDNINFVLALCYAWGYL